MRVLVTGGRFWLRRRQTRVFLDLVHEEIGIDLLIHGGAKGADRMCAEWAKDRGIEVLLFEPDWVRDGKMSAGKIRNQRMIDEGKPDLLLAFPGEGGTADMKAKAKRAGIKIRMWIP